MNSKTILANKQKVVKLPVVSHFAAVPAALAGSRWAMEDVEIITALNQIRSRQRQAKSFMKYKEHEARKQERAAGLRKIIRRAAIVFLIVMAVLVGVYLAMGDILSCCACILMVLFSATVIAENGEYDDGK